MPQDGSGNYAYPLGTRGVPDETIESAAYNNFLDDLVGNDLNAARPIHRGGTGAITADAALLNLGAEKAAQLVTNYDTHIWLPGSFRSAGSATAGPVDGHAFAGIVYINEPLASPPTNANVTVSARDMNDTVVPSRVYVREKKAGVWGAWSVVDATTMPFPPGGGITADTILEAIQELDAEKASIVYVDTTKVAKSGGADGIMTGLLTLSGPPTIDLHAATKQYVDAFITPASGLASDALQINGSGQVSQEFGFGSPQNSGYFCDGWITTSVGTMVAPMSSATTALSDPPNNLLGQVTTAQASLAAGDHCTISTHVEGYRAGRLLWGKTPPTPITICFFSSHTVAGLYSGSIKNSAANRSYVFTYTQNVASTGEWKTITIPPPPDGTWLGGDLIGMTVSFSRGCGATKTASAAGAWLTGDFVAAPGQVNLVASTSHQFVLSNFVMLPGAIAPISSQASLLLRPYHDEIALCQRYYQKQTSRTTGTILASGVAVTATGGLFHVRFPVQMRAPPALSLSHAASNYLILGANTTGGAASSLSSLVADNSIDTARIDVVTTALVAGQALTMQTNGAGVSLAFNARL